MKKIYRILLKIFQAPPRLLLDPLIRINQTLLVTW